MIENNEEYKKYMHYTLSEINDQINELQRDVKYLDDLLSNRIKEDIKKYCKSDLENRLRWHTILYRIRHNGKSVDRVFKPLPPHQFTNRALFKYKFSISSAYVDSETGGYMEFPNPYYPWKIKKSYYFGRTVYHPLKAFSVFSFRIGKLDTGSLSRIFMNAKFFALIDLMKSEKKLSALQEAEEIQESRNKKFETKIERSEALLEKHRAFSYAHQEKTRDLADDLKPRMQKEQIKIIGEVCPYCQQSIGADPHLDHIHPVSKGGLSRKENLILICKKCNLEKSDQTLRNFIKIFNLDEHKISTNLELLGKDW